MFKSCFRWDYSRKFLFLVNFCSLKASSFWKNCFMFINVDLHICMLTTCVLCDVLPADGGNYHVGAKNQTQTLHKSSKCSSTLSHLLAASPLRVFLVNNANCLCFYILSMWAFYFFVLDLCRQRFALEMLELPWFHILNSTVCNHRGEMVHEIRCN